MTLLKEPDFGTPAKDGPATVSVEVDGLQRRRARGHVGDAGGCARRGQHSEALCDGHASTPSAPAGCAS